MKKTFIYGLVDPRTDKIKYIGKSNKPNKRLREHISDSKKKAGCGTKKENWIYKLLKLNLEPYIEILCEVKIEEYEYWEEFYIKKYKNNGTELLNYDNKGIGAASNMKLLTNKSKEKKQKKVHQYSLDGEYIKEYISVREAGRQTNINHGNISKVCNNIWNHAGGYIFSYNKKDKIYTIKNPNASKKVVLEIDDKNNTLKEYTSISEAAKKQALTLEI